MAGSLRVDHAVSSGTFSLDGETFDVDNNIWVVGDDDECVVIDAPHSVDDILAVVGDRTVKAIVCTHAHDDHVRAAPELRDKTGAPILPAFCVRDRNDSYVAVGGRPLFLTKSEDHAGDVGSAMEDILRTFEGYIKMYPDQWHVLEPIWPDTPTGAAVTLATSKAQAAVGDQGGSLG